jgi:hypothetical protein
LTPVSALLRSVRELEHKPIETDSQANRLVRIYRRTCTVTVAYTHLAKVMQRVSQKYLGNVEYRLC